MGVYLFSPQASHDTPALELVSKRFQALVLGLLLAGLAVGMGGTFYPHHYIFAVPLLLAPLFLLMQRLPDDTSKQAWVRASFVVLALATVNIPWTRAKVFRERVAVSNKLDAQSRESAVIIDGLLDRLHVDRYMYLGPGGFLPTPFTRHAPLGPLFFQQVMFFGGQYPSFVAKFWQDLDEAQVVVMRAHFTASLDDAVKKKLAAEFRPLPSRFIPEGMHCQDPILVRKNLKLQ
jgi:hypothetical protein